jgi:hypothetical protein
VFHIQHVAPTGSPVFAEGSDTALQHCELQPAPQHTVQQKSTVSVFHSTDLDARLKAAGVQRSLIARLMTHACVAGPPVTPCRWATAYSPRKTCCACRWLENGKAVQL